MIELMLEYAKSMLGVPYQWGGATPMGGLDCSGFVQECLAAVGLDPAGDQTAQGLYDHFKARGASKPQAGALLFFGKNSAAISHVALALTDKFMIEAGGGGSAVRNREDAINHQAFIRIRPIGRRSDLVGCFMPL